MRKKSMKKLTKAIFAPIVKGLIIFAVFGLALYAYAITFPSTDPAPVTGVVGTFVGLSDSGYTSGISGYEDLNELCKTGNITSPTEGALTNVGAHVCTAMEIQNSYNHDVEAVALATGLGIINEGPPGYVVYANDCNGWNVRTAQFLQTPAFGAVWIFDDGDGTTADDISALVRCDWLATYTDTYKIACCK